MIEYVTRKESIGPGRGWHTVQRVLVPSTVSTAGVRCPVCGNTDLNKFETHAPGLTLLGFLCLCCMRT